MLALGNDDEAPPVVAAGRSWMQNILAERMGTSEPGAGCVGQPISVWEATREEPRPKPERMFGCPFESAQLGRGHCVPQARLCV